MGKLFEKSFPKPFQKLSTRFIVGANMVKKRNDTRAVSYNAEISALP